SALSLKWQARVLGWLERLKVLGGRLLPGWEGDARAVRDWVAGPPEGNLTRPRPVLLSPIHGDLNRTNVLVWVASPPQAFLIDFANYRENGPAVYDLAHLEAEVKFLLMDCEETSPARAFDHDHTQLERWCALEEHLASTGWAGERATLGEGVDRALRLSQRLRKEAEGIHQRGMAGNNQTRPFGPEYLATLLYHTLRVVGYPQGPSTLKRLLAAFGAARLIEALRAS